MTFDGVGWPAAAASLTLIVLSMALAASIGLGVGRDIAVASGRAAVQLLAVGLVFTAIFTSASAFVWAWLWVAAMVTVAWRVVLRRATSAVSGLAGPVAGAIAGATAISLAIVFGFGVIPYEPVAVVVVAGITIGNAVPVAVLGVDQSVEQCRDRLGELEAVLSLGFDRPAAVRFLAPPAARAALIPQIERTKVVGIIALPGAMTGLLLAGIDPVDAVVVQLLVMYLVLGSAALAVVTVVATVTRSAVTPDLGVAGWVLPGAPEAIAEPDRREAGGRQ